MKFYQYFVGTVHICEPASRFPLNYDWYVCIVDSTCIGFMAMAVVYSMACYIHSACYSTEYLWFTWLYGS